MHEEAVHLARGGAVEGGVVAGCTQLTPAGMRATETDMRPGRAENDCLRLNPAQLECLEQAHSIDDGRLVPVEARDLHSTIGIERIHDEVEQRDGADNSQRGYQREQAKANGT